MTICCILLASGTANLKCQRFKHTSLGDISAACSSGSHVNLSSPVKFRSLRVLRYKIFGELVSGSRKNKATKQKPDSHMSSQIVHVQPSAITANPPIKGPTTGPQTAPIPQIARPYACFCGRYMSAMVAPPVASAGEPKNPVRKRNANSMPKLVARAVGSWKSTKITTQED